VAVNLTVKDMFQHMRIARMKQKQFQNACPSHLNLDPLQRCGAAPMYVFDEVGKQLQHGPMDTNHALSPILMATALVVI